MQLEYRTHTVLGSDKSKAEAFAHLKSVGNNVCIRLVQKEEKRIFEHTMSMFPTQQCVGNINLPPDVHIWWQIYNLCSSPSTAGQTVMLLEQMGAAVVVIVLGGDGGLNASL